MCESSGSRDHEHSGNRLGTALHAAADRRAAALAETAMLEPSFHFPAPARCEIGRVEFFRVQIVGDFGCNQPGNRHLAGSTLTGDPVGPTCQAPTPQDFEASERLVLANPHGSRFYGDLP